MGKRADVYLVIGILYGKRCFELIFSSAPQRNVINLNIFAMERKVYVKPEIELLTVKVENGFAVSDQQLPSPWEDM